MSYVIQITLYRFLFFGVTGWSQCYLAIRLNTPKSSRWEEPPAVCCRLPGYLPFSLKIRLRPRIHHRGPPPVTHDVSRLTRHPRPAAPYRNSSATVTHPPFFILLLHLHRINYLCRAFARRSYYVSWHFLCYKCCVTNVATYVFSGNVKSSHRSGNLPNNGRFDSKW